MNPVGPVSLCSRHVAPSFHVIPSFPLNLVKPFFPCAPLPGHFVPVVPCAVVNPLDIVNLVDTADIVDPVNPVDPCAL